MSSRLEKSMNERMCLLKVVNESGTDTWCFQVRGEKYTVYDQTFTKDKCQCTCMDYKMRKGVFCKHLLFLVVRAGKNYPLGVIMTGNAPVWTLDGFTKCAEAWATCLQPQKPTEPNMTVNPEDPCAICFEDLGQIGLVECITTCHAHFHGMCMERWLQHGRNCPNCRSPWLRNQTCLDHPGYLNQSVKLS